MQVRIRGREVHGAAIAIDRGSPAMAARRVEAESAEKQLGLAVADNFVQDAKKDLARCFQQAAEQGDARAQFDLSTCYRKGSSVERDPAQAVRWYRQAAEQGHAKAQLGLGFCYERGTGVERDPAQAARWYRQAAKQGHAKAQFNLGVFYERGIGVERDPARAARWYRQAAEQGRAEAQFNLGVCYERGIGMKLDHSRAAFRYRQAAEQGLAEAQFNLGGCYLGGIGVEQDTAQAASWYRQAAEQRFLASFLMLYHTTTDPEEKLQCIDEMHSCLEQRPAEIADLSHGDVVVCDLPLGMRARPKGQKAQHWALYDAHNQVFLERTNANLSNFWASSSGPFAHVQATSAADLASRYPDGFKVLVWPEAAHQDLAFDRDVAVARARARLGEGGYNALERNCEHFVMECLVPGTLWDELGLGTSLQAERFKHGATLLESFVAALMSNASARSFRPKP